MSHVARTCQDGSAVRPDGVEYQAVSAAESWTQQSSGRRERLADDYRAGAGELLDVERRRHLKRHPLAVGHTHPAPVAAWTARAHATTQLTQTVDFYSPDFKHYLTVQRF